MSDEIIQSMWTVAEVFAAYICLGFISAWVIAVACLAASIPRNIYGILRIKRYRHALPRHPHSAPVIHPDYEALPQPQDSVE